MCLCLQFFCKAILTARWFNISQLYQKELWDLLSEYENCNVEVYTPITNPPENPAIIPRKRVSDHLSEIYAGNLDGVFDHITIDDKTKCVIALAYLPIGMTT